MSLLTVIFLLISLNITAFGSVSSNNAISKENGWSYWMDSSYREAGTHASFEDGKFTASIKSKSRKSKYYLQLIKNTNILEAGKSYKVSFQLKSGGSGVIQVVYIMAEPPYTGLAYSTINITPGKKSYDCVITPGLIDGKYPEKRSLRFFTGELAGADITISDVSIEETSTDMANTIIDINFANTGQALNIKEKGKFSGVLPSGVTVDFPRWNTSVAHTEKLTQNNREFLRFKVDRIDQAVLFKVSDTKIKCPGYYKLEVDTRSIDRPVNVHFRHQGRPYSTLWQQNTATDPKWNKQIMAVDLSAFKQTADNNYSDIVLYLSFKEGVADIASLKLTKINKEQFIALKKSIIALEAQKISRLPEGTLNFFRNSRFPLGMQSGWNINRSNLTGRVEADPGTPGPSGAPSLKIDFKPIASTDRAWTNRLHSEPFQVDDPRRKVHVSFYYKTEQDWRVLAKGVNKTIPASKEWKRFEFSFSPDPNDRAFNLIFQGTGVMYLDSLMAHSGKPGQPYVSAGECEIALTDADSDLKGTRIVFDDEPALVRYAATGKLDGAVLKIKVVNIYGKEKMLADVNLKTTPAGTLDFNVFPETPLGAFRVEAWAERDGKRISPYNELVMNRVRRPVYWGKDAPNSPFGGHFLAKDRVINTMKAAGFNWLRAHDSSAEVTGWAFLEKKPGEWTFADDKIKAFRDANIMILGQLASAPGWASFYEDKYKHRSEYFDRMYIPKNEEAFRNYVRTVARRYKGVIDEYQFWNEPWGDKFWHKSYDRATDKFCQGDDPAGDYVKFLKITYRELKKVNPEAKLHGFSTTYGTKGREWTKKVFDAGAYDFCDKIDYHYYNGALEFPCNPDDMVAGAYSAGLQYIKDHVNPPMKPVVMSEGNPTRSGFASEAGKDDYSGLMKHTLPWEPRDPSRFFAEMTCRFVISHLALGIEKIFLYSDHTYHNMLKNPGYTTVLGIDGYPHPTFAAFSNMAWLLEDRTFVEYFSITEHVWAYVFHGRDGKSVAVITGSRNSRAVIPKISRSEVIDLFGNPLPHGVYQGEIIYVLSELPPKQLKKSLLTKKQKDI
jgi:hypothetical protein